MTESLTFVHFSDTHIVREGERLRGREVCSCGALAIDQHEVPDIDYRTYGLRHHKDGFSLKNGICKRDEASGQAQIPKVNGNDALAFAL